jgi:hypothetical protein
MYRPLDISARIQNPNLAIIHCMRGSLHSQSHPLDLRKLAQRRALQTTSSRFGMVGFRHAKQKAATR